MRVHCDQPFTLYLDVYIDDEKQTACIAADDEAGWALCYRHDLSGRFVHVDGHPILARQIRYGRVQLRMRESAPRWACEQYLQCRGDAVSIMYQRD